MMDHTYAVSASDDVCITPTPPLSPSSLDGNSAHQPSEPRQEPAAAAESSQTMALSTGTTVAKQNETLLPSLSPSLSRRKRRVSDREMGERKDNLEECQESPAGGSAPKRAKVGDDSTALTGDTDDTDAAWKTGENAENDYFEKYSGDNVEENTSVCISTDQVDGHAADREGGCDERMLPGYVPKARTRRRSSQSEALVTGETTTDCALSGLFSESVPRVMRADSPTQSAQDSKHVNSVTEDVPVPTPELTCPSANIKCVEKDFTPETGASSVVKSVSEDSAPKVTDISSDYKSVPEDSVPKVTDISSDYKSVSENSAPKVTDISSDYRSVSEDSAPKVTDISSDYKSVSEDSAPKVTDISSDYKSVQSDSVPEMGVSSDCRSVQDSTPEVSGASIDSEDDTDSSNITCAEMESVQKDLTPEVTGAVFDNKDVEKGFVPELVGFINDSQSGGDSTQEVKGVSSDCESVENNSNRTVVASAEIDTTSAVNESEENGREINQRESIGNGVQGHSSSPRPSGCESGNNQQVPESAFPNSMKTDQHAMHVDESDEHSAVSVGKALAEAQKSDETETCDFSAGSDSKENVHSSSVSQSADPSLSVKLEKVSPSVSPVKRQVNELDKTPVVGQKPASPASAVSSGDHLTSLLKSANSVSSGTGSPRKLSPCTSVKRPKVPKADVADLPLPIENYLLPLTDYGWKREVVVRGVYDESKAKFPPADIYYFTPQGKKLRSKVMVTAYLEKTPQPPIRAENFTFIKKSISEEPWEIVRSAGTTHPGRPGRVVTPKSSPIGRPGNVVTPKSSPIISPQKWGITGGPKSASLQNGTINTASLRKRCTLSRKRNADFVELDDDDIDYEDYSPWEKSEKRKLKKSRLSFGKHKSLKRPRTPPDCEVLIQSLPSPDIVIDTAEETFYFDENSAGNGHKAAGEQENSRKNCMMILPSDIKQELSDSAEEKEEHHSFALKPKRILPTARKSTMPRIVLKKKSKSKTPVAAKGSNRQMTDGPLCNNWCPGLDGLAPSLQCSVCMCLFHHQCVNVPNAGPLPDFRCLRCKNLKRFGRDGRPPETQMPSANIATIATSTSISSVTAVGPQKTMMLRAPSAPAATSVSAPIPPPRFLPFQVPFVQAKSTFPPAAPIPSQRLFVPNQSLPFAVVRPPHLIQGGLPQAPVQPINLVTTQNRPPPRLTARPRMLAPKSQQKTQQPAVSVVASTPPPVPNLVVPPAHRPLHQMLTLPTSVTSHLNLSRPLMVKLNNLQVMVPPSCVLNTQDGLRSALSSVKVVLPPSTFHVPPNSSTTPRVMVSVASNSPTSTSTGLSSSSLTSTPSLSAILSSSNLTSTPSLNAALLPSKLTSTPSLNAALLPSNLTSTPSLNAALLPSNLTSTPSLNAALLPSNLTSTPSLNAALLPSNLTSTPSLNAALLSGLNSQITSPNLSSTDQPVSQDPAVSSSKDSTDSQRAPPKRTRRQQAADSQCAIHRLQSGFDCMLAIFQYLGVQDLLRAGQVCKTWNNITQQKCLWQKVILKGQSIKDWNAAADFMNCNKTRTLIFDHSDAGDGTSMELSWSPFTKVLDKVKCLQHIEFGLVPPFVLHSVCDSLCELEVLKAVHITQHSDDNMWSSSTKLDVGKFASLTKLKELHLRGVTSLDLPTFTFSGCLQELTNLKNLHSLSLTSLCGLRDSDFSFLEDMKQLKLLEIGDCLNWTCETYKLLGELSNLEHLSLECGGEIPDNGLGPAIAQLTKLKKLKLILFAIPETLQHSFQQLTELETLVMWPYSDRGPVPAVVNSCAIAAVAGLTQLKKLEWAVVAKDTNPETPDSSPPVFTQQNTIPLVRPGVALDPMMSVAAGDLMHVSPKGLTAILLMTLPQAPSITVFNTSQLPRKAV